MKKRALEIYLSDHFGGSIYAVELIRSCVDTYPDPPLGPFFENLLRDVQEDQEVLRTFLLRIGGTESPIKSAAAWAAEKLSRIKHIESSEFPGAGLLERLETLSLGVVGKRSLWQALGAASGGTGRFGGVEVAKLERRAEDQLQEIERHRLAAARQAFVVGDHVRGRPDANAGAPPLRAVLLDVDGTLIDTNDAHAKAWQDVLAEAGHRVSFERVRPLVGMGGERIVKRLAGVDPKSGEGRAIARAHTERFLGHYLEGCRPFRSVRALLERMRDAGLVLVVVTSAEEDVMARVLGVAGVADLLAAATSSSEVEHSKPDADVIEAGLARARCEAAEALLLGDTPYDVQSGTRAGVGVIALRCGGSGDAELAGALAVYDDPAALLERFESSPFAQQPARSAL